MSTRTASDSTVVDDMPPPHSPPGLSPAASELPSYNEAAALSSADDKLGRDLKESFGALMREQLDVQRLFATVAARLEHTPRIGREHALYAEWTGLRERHNRLHRDSQQSAAQCANFLHTFSTVLIPLSTSSMNCEEKKMMIGKFLETIPAHQEKARITSSRFNELVHDVEGFPSKVTVYLKQAESAEASGFWQKIWAGLKQICAAFWRALQRVFEEIISAFRGMFDRIQRIQCSFAMFFVTVDMFDPASRPSSLPGRKVPNPLERDCEQLAHSLRMFEDSWHLVSVACSMLLDKVTFAGKLTSIPLACDATLRTVDRVYVPLLESLQAYSVGKAPKW